MKEGELELKISVVISTYNGERYIEEQMTSILRQSRKPDEVLILDDCSKDNTTMIIDNFIRNNSLNDRWNLSINRINQGWRKNFKKGLCMATGDLIFPCDQDDIWNEKKLEICEKIMGENSKIKLLTSGYTEFRDEIPLITRNISYTVNQHSYKENLFRINYPGCTFCIKKEFLQQMVDFWDETFPHDATILRFANMMDGFYSTDARLILWRKYAESSFSRELKARKNKDEKMEWINYAKTMISQLEKFINTVSVSDGQQKGKLLDKNRKWILLREKLFLTHKKIYILELLQYFDCYPYKVMFFSDILIAIKGRKIKNEGLQ